MDADEDEMRLANRREDWLIYILLTMSEASRSTDVHTGGQGH